MHLKRMKPYLKTILAFVWFVFTFSLVSWWWIYSLLRSQEITPKGSAQRMFVWEGSILLGAILVGGIALIIFTYRDQKRHERLRFFFSTFSHDIKTSIARLRLQAEVLEEEQSAQSNPVMQRLIKDIQRLDLQLENSLLLANVEDGKLLDEEVSLGSLFDDLRNDFPDLSIELEKEAFIIGDRRALLSVFRNLLQNSVLHGKATAIRIKVIPMNDRQLELHIEDNGLGFKGDASRLGSELLISTDSRGNGIGLLLTKRLVQKMKGRIQYKSKEHSGFESVLFLNGHIHGYPKGAL